MRISRRALPLLGAALAAPALAAAPAELRIGYPKAGPLVILSRRGTLEARLAPLGHKVRWIEFTAGPQLLEALGAGGVDFGMTGDAPPIFAQARGLPLRYLGFEPAAPRSQAILVKRDGPIADVAGLRGKRLGVQRGSNAHYLVVAHLAAAGLKPADVNFAFLTAPDGRVAFSRGDLDAWAVWDPLLSAALAGNEARVLADGGTLSSNHFYYLATEALAADARVTAALLDEIAATGAWIMANQREAAALMAPASGLEASVWEAALERAVFGARPIGPEPLVEQQRIADTFAELGVLPRRVRVAELAPAA